MWEHSNEGQYTPYVLKTTRFHKPLSLRRTLWLHLPGYKSSWQGHCGPSRSAFRPTEEILRSWERAYRRERDRNGSIRKRVAIKGKEDLEPESSTEREPQELSSNHYATEEEGESQETVRVLHGCFAHASSILVQRFCLCVSVHGYILPRR